MTVVYMVGGGLTQAVVQPTNEELCYDFRGWNVSGHLTQAMQKRLPTNHPKYTHSTVTPP